MDKVLKMYIGRNHSKLLTEFMVSDTQREKQIYKFTFSLATSTNYTEKVWKQLRFEKQSAYLDDYRARAGQV